MKKNGLKSVLTALMAILAVLSGCTGMQVPGQVSSTIDLTVLATTDIHTYFMDYDYFIDQPTERYGLVRLGTEIGRQRRENHNVLLFDNGDTIQGNPFGDYLSKNPPSPSKPSPMMEIMNYLKYDAGTLGNHEFNFGLDYLKKVMEGAKFPIVNANVVHPGTEKPYFTPYTLLKRTFVDATGKKQNLKIGVIGLTPPRIMVWDNLNLSGKVDVRSAYTVTEKYVEELKKKKADIIIVLSHSGLSDSASPDDDENFSYQLTDIPGIDAIITGHSHLYFPGKGFADLSGADGDGRINGVPVVMSGSFGDNLGVITLQFEKSGGIWKRTGGISSLVPVYTAAADSSPAKSIPPDQTLVDLLKPAHEAVLAYIRAPVGAASGGEGAKLTAPLTSFFALVHDDYSVQLINEAQLFYAKKYLETSEYKSLPVLSAAAPFKYGGRSGPGYFTNVPAGPLAIKNMADIYVFSNTLVILKITGAEVREWLERSAGQFNQIKADASGLQELINSAMPTYNFDVFEGVTYGIDVSQPSRYAPAGSGAYKAGDLVNPDAHRIVDLQYNGSPIKEDQEFLVVSNNYRAGGGGSFPGAKPANIIYSSPDENRLAILQYIEAKKRIDPSADGNWRLIIPAGAGLVFWSSPDAKDNLIPGVAFDSVNAEGFGVYRIDPSQLQ
ncbi:MAG: bifunctional 2',3'-cyclic-nucleotide 2'-phosphodiesterase/3'-nucleotidase [Spirochaetaceae bacterium]|jgi:2',3'-cyclic-nucleotide 2'-phosphodiesterase/3'-nucleotidase|nr:bifunctional 2',3'-cyclic-nucleotide 2'-phosphodiesterase/3'-nucleotidase [Spirochaetaceae bacterium]